MANKDLRDKTPSVIQEYINQNDKGYIALYTASKSATYSNWNKEFLLVERTEDVDKLNDWLEEKYGKQLEEETGYEIPAKGDIDSYGNEKRHIWTCWIDYLTDDMWDYTDGDHIDCCSCGKVIRYRDTVSVMQNHILTDWGILCTECFESDETTKQDYLNNLIDNPRDCNTMLDLSEYGFKQYNNSRYEAGWYGTNQLPEDIFKKAKLSHPNYEFVFQLDEAQPFATFYDLFCREKEEK